MANLVSKPISEISVEDLNELIDQKVPESEHLEYKSTLSAEQGQDRWLDDQSDIGKLAKTSILEEVVAFANADGGVLLVGIEESKDDQHIAKSIKGLPKCNNLVDRFKGIFRDSIEPSIPSLEITAIQTEEEKGVMLVRVGKSRAAPHRVKTSRRCMVRRQDRCEELSMNDIQTLILNTSRGLKRIDKDLKYRKKKFEKEFSRLTTPNQALGIRFTGVPIDERRDIDKLFVNRTIDQRFSLPIFEIKQDDRRLSEHEYLSECLSGGDRPILRGARRDTYRLVKPLLDFAYSEIYCSGLVELGYLSAGEYFQTIRLDPEIVIGFFAHLLKWVEKVRDNAISPRTEYLINLEFRVRDAPVRLGYNRGYINTMDTEVHLSDTSFPPYPFYLDSDIELMLNQFRRDLFNWVGWDTGDGEVSYSFNELRD